MYDLVNLVSTDGLTPDIKDYIENRNLDEVQRQNEFETSTGRHAYRCSDADSEGRTPLHHLVKQERPSKLKLEALLQDNSDLNCADNYGETPLHFAAALGTSEIVSLLLKYGSNPNLINTGGETPLDLALKNPRAGTLVLSELTKLTTIKVTHRGQSQQFETADPPQLKPLKSWTQRLREQRLRETQTKKSLAQRLRETQIKIASTASFDCTQAATETEIAICESPSQSLPFLLESYDLIRKNLSEITKLPLECISYEFETSANSEVDWSLREIHNAQCGGDPNTSPRVAFLKTAIYQKNDDVSLSVYDTPCGCWMLLNY